jgi:hypothetical protein
MLLPLLRCSGLPGMRERGVNSGLKGRCDACCCCCCSSSFSCWPLLAGAKPAAPRIWCTTAA